MTDQAKPKVCVWVERGHGAWQLTCQHPDFRALDDPHDWQPRERCMYCDRVMAVIRRQDIGKCAAGR